MKVWHKFAVIVKGENGRNGINKINWGHFLRAEFSDSLPIKITPHVIFDELTKCFYFKDLKRLFYPTATGIVPGT